MSRYCIAVSVRGDRFISTGPVCANGLVAIDGQCYLQGEAPVIGPPQCPSPDGSVGDCYRVISPLRSCPGATTEDAHGRCLWPTAAVADFSCQVGQLVDDQCLAPYDSIGPWSCFVFGDELAIDADFVAGVCVVEGPLPQPLPGVCPDIGGWVMVDTGDECYAVFDLLPGGGCERR